MKYFYIAILVSIFFGSLSFGVVPVVQSGDTWGAISGPAQAAISSSGNSQYLRILYWGILLQKGPIINVGVVQNKFLLGLFPMQASKVYAAWIPLSLLKDGPFELYFTNINGEFDSDYENNFPFILKR